MSDFWNTEEEKYRIPGTNSYLIPPEVVEKQKQLSSHITYGASREKDLDSSHIIYATVTVAGEEILKNSHFSLSVSSKISQHDYFEILCPSEEFAETLAYPLSNSKYLLGKRCTLQFKQFGKSVFVFTGILTAIENRRIDGYSHIALIGASPTVLLDGAENCRSFENQNLSEIMTRVLEAYPTDRVQGNLRSHIEEKLSYTVQYNQSDWQFLQSLCARYGENLFYNGEQIVLGGWGGKTVELFEEQDFFEYRLQMKVMPQHFTYTAYDYNRAETLSVYSEENIPQESKNPFQQFAQETSEKIFSVQPQKHYTGSLSELDNLGLNRAVKKKQLENKNVTVVEMKTHNPNLRLGDIIKMHGWMPGHKIFKDGNLPLESYKIIEIYHEFKDGDGYYNRLKAIPKDLEVAPVEEIPQAVCENQSAVVTNNKDPQGMGRVRVRFAWQSANEQSPWIRQVQPHSGSGKGFYFIPEIAEEVLIGFEDHNPEKPFVLGTHYNGKETSGYYTQGNDIKVIQTRSGTKIVFNDAEGQGSILVEDPSGNKLFMDGEGNISVNAPKNFSVHAGEDIVLSAGKNMITNVGVDQTTSVGANAHTTVGMQYSLFAADIFETASGNITSDSSQTIRNASQNIETHSAEGNIIQNAQSIVKNNSGEKSTQF